MVDINTGTVADWVDMATRHPRYFGRTVPVATRINRKPPNPPQWTGGAEQWRPLVAAHFPAGQVDTALCVIQHESGGNPDAKNPRSSASGLFQHLARYWPERTVKAGVPGASIWDPQASTVVAAWLWSTGGWGHWTAHRHCR